MNFEISHLVKFYLNVWLVAIWTLMYIPTFRRVHLYHFYSEWIQCKPRQFLLIIKCAKSLGIGPGLGSSSFKTTDFFRRKLILICDQLRICFKRPYVTLVLNSYLVRCLSASTSSNTSSVHNFHSMLKLAFCNKFDIKFVYCTRFVYVLRTKWLHTRTHSLRYPTW